MTGFHHYNNNQEQYLDDATYLKFDPIEYLNDLPESEEWCTEEVQMDEVGENPENED